MDWTIVRDLAGTLLLVSGGLVAFLTLIDWTLRKNQKEWLRGRFETLWLVISDWRATSLIARLEDPQFVYRLCFWFYTGFGFLGGAAGLIYLLIGLLSGDPVVTMGSQFPYLIGFVVVFTVTGFLMRPVWFFLLSRAIGGKYHYRFYLWGIGAVLIVPATFVLLELVGTLVALFEPSPQALKVIIVAFVIFFIALYMMLLFALFIFGAAMLAAISAFLLTITRFVVLRLAEYEKGPVLGASAALVALGTLAKQLS